MNIKDMRQKAKNAGLSGEIRLIMNKSELGRYLSGTNLTDNEKAAIFRRAAGNTNSEKRKAHLLSEAEKAENISGNADSAGDDLSTAAEIFAESIRKNRSVNQEQVREIVSEMIDEIPAEIITVDRQGMELGTVKGVKHERFQDVMDVITSGLNPFLVGPTGSGKSFLAEQTSAALGLPFSAHSFCPETGSHEINGYYEHGTGKYRTTAFRETYETGGVYLMDEVDAAPADITLLVNNAISNGIHRFPDKPVKKHKDFILIAAGNTIAGATENYNGREKQDAAFLDRFVEITVHYDEKFEKKLLSTETADLLQKLRRSIDELGYDIPVSTRAGIQIEKLNKTNWNTTKKICSTILKGQPLEMKKRVLGGIA